MRVDFSVDTENPSDLARAQQLIAMLARQGGRESAESEDLPFMQEYGEQERQSYEIPDSIEPDEPVAAPARKMQARRQEKAVDVPAGRYAVCLHDLLIEQSQSGKKMAVFDFAIADGRFAKRHLFMRQVFSGTKNDARCIAGIEGIVDQLMRATGGKKIAWRGASAGQVKGFADALSMEKIPFDWDKSFDVDYDPARYQSIKIL